MRERPDDIDDGALRRALTAWGIYDAALAYEPVGFGDHHWTAEAGTVAAADAPLGDAQRWFVTVADLTAKPYCGTGADAAAHGLRRAMDTAAGLRDRAGLDFVVAPLLTRHGETLHRLDEHGGRYGVSVFAHVTGVPGRFGESATREETARLVDLLARLHRAEPPPCAPVAPAGLPEPGRVEEALGDLGRPWAGGVYGERARALLADHAPALRERLGAFTAGLDRLAARGGDLVVTHGEPHPGNLLRAAGADLLVDWDTVGLAEPERDLWMVAAAPEDLARYADATGRTPDPGALELYRLRWDLDDVGAFATLFRGPHPENQDTARSWTALAGTVERLVSL